MNDDKMESAENMAQWIDRYRKYHGKEPSIEQAFRAGFVVGRVLLRKEIKSNVDGLFDFFRQAGSGKS